MFYKCKNAKYFDTIGKKSTIVQCYILNSFSERALDPIFDRLWHTSSTWREHFIRLGWWRWSCSNGIAKWWSNNARLCWTLSWIYESLRAKSNTLLLVCIKQFFSRVEWGSLTVDSIPSKKAFDVLQTRTQDSSTSSHFYYFNL